MKIAYHASVNQISILEHFMNAIVSSYKALLMDPAEEILATHKEGSCYTNQISGKLTKVKNLMAVVGSFAPVLRGMAKL